MANHSGANIGQTADAITATHMIVSEWPDGKELYCRSKLNGMKPYCPISKSSRGRRRPKNNLIVCRIRLPTARLAMNATAHCDAISRCGDGPQCPFAHCV